VDGMLGDEVDPDGEFADRRKATNLNQRPDYEDGPAPDPPALRLSRWGGLRQPIPGS
jgi:hypothetical protein